MRVFVIWEPILFTDWFKPGSRVRGRVSDSRATHYWDPENLLAKRMARDRRPPQPEPECCETGGILWDLVAVYPADAVWTETMPPAVLFNGIVLDKENEIEALVAKAVP